MQCSDVNKGGEVLLIHIFLPTLSFQSRGLNRQHSSSLILINTQYCTMNDELLHVDTGFWLNKRRVFKWFRFKT